MKRFILVIILLAPLYKIDAQIIFEPGYFITNEGERISCLIKNVDWKNNPVSFEYKTDEHSPIQVASISDVNEFRVIDGPHYERFTVDIERSEGNLQSLDYNAQPEFSKEQLFLRYLVAGEASLYAYTDGKISKFFIKKDTLPVEQLISIAYKVSESSIATNEKFRQQLFVNLQCESLSKSTFEDVSYTRKDLIKLFSKYNECKGQPFTNYFEKGGKGGLNFSLRPGVHYSKLFINNSALRNSEVNFSNKLGERLGLEFEFVMSFNKNKWAFIIEPTFQRYHAKKNAEGRNVEVDYKSLEVPIGLRHYFFLNQKNKIFVNLLIAYDFPFNSFIQNHERGYILDVKSRTNFSFGTGFNHNNKLQIEFRYQFAREILSDYIAWNSKYAGGSFIVGYTVF